MIYFLVSTSLYNNCSIRELQYITGINKLKEVIKIMDIQNYKIIIIENNGQRDTFLNNLGEEVFYTNNNFLNTNNKGYKELQDIFDCIEKYKIHDQDFIVKITGRYILENDSEFMKIVKTLENNYYDCIIKYGPFFKPVDYKMEDCITGLIGMTCKYVKQIEKPVGFLSVEWNWAKVTYLMNENNIYKVNKLGINICPIYYNNTNYFLV